MTENYSGKEEKSFFAEAACSNIIGGSDISSPEQDFSS